jgi:hypothetical protein
VYTQFSVTLRSRKDESSSNLPEANWNKLGLIWQGSVPHPGEDLRPVRGEHGHLQAGAGAQARPQQHHSGQAY